PVDQWRPKSREQVPKPRVAVEVIHRVIQPESVYAVVKFPIAIGVCEKGKQPFVICEHAGVVKVDGRDLAAVAIVSFQLGDAPDDRSGFLMGRVLEKQTVATGRSEIADGGGPPGVPIGDILRLHVDIQFHSANMQCPGETGEVFYRSVTGVDGIPVVREIIMIEHGLIQRRKEYGGDAQLLQITELFLQTPEIADAVAIGVEEAALKNMIDDLFLGKTRPCRRG